MPIYDDQLAAIGHTPLVRINRLAHGLPATVLAKVEGRNPSCSVKCRIAAGMVWDAEQHGRLGPGIRVVEATSGNTGIALAFACAARKYALTLTMPDTMSIERRAMLRSFGAQLILTPGSEGMQAAIAAAEKIAKEPGWFMPRQFENPANPEIHFRTTGPEIWEDTRGRVDVVVAGVGTGGTLTGVGRYLKQERQAPVSMVAVEPANSAVLSGGAPGKHRIQGIGAGFIPAILDRSLIDEVLTVTDDDAIDGARALAREEGITAGISSGAAIAAALRIAARRELAGKTVVAILPDLGERYLSTTLFDGMRDPDPPRTSTLGSFDPYLLGEE